VYMSRKKDIFDRITKIIRITFDQLNEIKQSKLSTYKLAKEYGVSNSYIWHVKQGNVKGEYHEYQLAK
jgi:predicted transcriptional regulator